VVLENVRDIMVVALQKLSMLILVVSTMRFSKCVSEYKVYYIYIHIYIYIYTQ
jgi:hypothetical protein